MEKEIGIKGHVCVSKEVKLLLKQGMELSEDFYSDEMKAAEKRGVLVNHLQSLSPKQKRGKMQTGTQGEADWLKYEDDLALVKILKKEIEEMPECG